MPETSRHIAKRMRELHDGIELLEGERDEGAFVWRNWDKWKDRCEEVISYLDEQILKGRQGPSKSRSDEWKKRGLVCGVEFTVFRQVVRKYRDWLYGQYGGPAGIRQKLVFAHNDVSERCMRRIMSMMLIIWRRNMEISSDSSQAENHLYSSQPTNTNN